jgi:hypothetical protein
MGSRVCVRSAFHLQHLSATHNTQPKGTQQQRLLAGLDERQRNSSNDVRTIKRRDARGMCRTSLKSNRRTSPIAHLKPGLFMPSSYVYTRLARLSHKPWDIYVYFRPARRSNSRKGWRDAAGDAARAGGKSPLDMTRISNACQEKVSMARPFSTRLESLVLSYEGTYEYIWRDGQRAYVIFLDCIRCLESLYYYVSKNWNKRLYFTDTQETCLDPSHTYVFGFIHIFTSLRFTVTGEFVPRRHIYVHECTPAPHLDREYDEDQFSLSARSCDNFEWLFSFLLCSFFWVELKVCK